LVVSIQYLLDRLDGVEQAAVVLEPVPGEHRDILCVDESFVSERTVESGLSMGKRKLVNGRKQKKTSHFRKIS